MIDEKRFYKTVIQLYIDEEFQAVEKMISIFAKRTGDSTDRIWSLVKRQAQTN